MTAEKQKHVFLSYAREDAASARQLRADLTALGVRIWFDEGSLLPGQNWRLEIQKAIRSSDFFVLILSRSSVTKRGVVQSELRDALDVMREMPEGTVFIVPARIEPVEPNHELLRDIQWVDLFDDWAEGVRRIGLTLFGKNQVTAQRTELINLTQMAKSVIETITTSDSNARIQVAGASDTAMVAGDPSLINIVLRELLANAVRNVTSDTNGKLPVLVEIRSTPEKVILQIRNRITVNAQLNDQPLAETSQGYGLWLARNAVIQWGGDLEIATRSIAEAEHVGEFVASLILPRVLPDRSMQSVKNDRVRGSGYIGDTNRGAEKLLKSSNRSRSVTQPRADRRSSQAHEQNLSITPWKNWLSVSSIYSRMVLLISIIGLFILGVWGSQWMRDKQGRTRSTFEQETARLNQNQNSVQNTEGSEIDFTLYPNSIRGDGERSTIISTAKAQVLRLHLLLMMDKYQRYQSTLITEDGKELLMLSGLSANIQDSGMAVIVKLPVQGLPSGDYRIKLSGETTDGITQEIASYYFRLVNK